MKKIMIVFAVLMFLPAGVLAVPVPILDTNVDRYGGDVFNVFSITVETDPTKPMSFSIATNYPQGGYSAQYETSNYYWNTRPADLILDVDQNNRWDYAIPLVNHYGWKDADGNYHDPYTAGRVYKVDSMWLSSDYQPSPYTWTYNDTPVSLYKGTDTGWSGTWTWNETSGFDPKYNIIYSGANWDIADLAINGYLLVYWATATCGNDTIGGTVYPSPVPEPATMLLLGTGLIGLAGFSRKKLFNK